jgi:NADH-quinone oxidoreductase subunit M
MSIVLLISLVPVGGSVAAALVASHQRATQWIAVICTSATLIGFLATQEAHTGMPTVLGVLLIVSAMLCVLGQQGSRGPDRASPIILLLLGETLGVLFADGLTSRVLLVSILITVLSAVWLLSGRLDSIRVGALVSFGAGALAVVGSLAVSGPPGSLLFIVGCATLLPLFPLHGGYVGSMASLPGTVPAFVAVALPCVGWYSLTTVQDFPLFARDGVIALAIISAMVGMVRAAAQIHLTRLLASIMVVLLAPAWWCLGSLGTTIPSGAYVAAVALASSGLVLGAYVLEARYGVRDIEKLSGLARPMPRFAFLMGLLFMAAMGLPLFAVFWAFMAMMFAVVPLRPSLFFVVVAWFLSSLLLSKVWHRIFYGPPRPNMLYADLSIVEVIPFVVLIALLLFSGPNLTRLSTTSEGAPVLAEAKP